MSVGRFLAGPRFALASPTEMGQSSLMNIKRLLLAIVAGYAVIFVTDMLIHKFWMRPDYEATQHIWRAKDQMGSYMGWMIGAQVLSVVTFVTLWALGMGSRTAKLSCAIGFGTFMGLFSGAWPIVLYVVLPIPCAIGCKWFFAGIVQCILLAIVTLYVYKPTETASAP